MSRGGKLPLIISRILDPFPFLILSIIIIISKLSLYNLGLNLGIFLVALLGFISYFIYLLKSGQVSDYDLKKRSERYRLYQFALGLIVGVSLLYLSLGELGIFIYTLGILGFVFIFYAISLKWKISFHTAAQAYFMGVMLHYFGSWFQGWSLALVAIAWARVKGGHHTWGQVVAGGLLSLGLSLCLFNFVL